jgi:hypothetical protein
MPPPTKLKDLAERNFFFVKWYWFATFPISVMFQNRLFPPLKVFGKSFDETKIIL